MQQRHRRLSLTILSAFVVVGLSGWAVGWFKATETVITEIAPGVFFRKMETEPKFLGSNQGWVIFKDFVLVIEASFPTQAEAVIKEIRKTTDKPDRPISTSMENAIKLTRRSRCGMVSLFWWCCDAGGRTF